MSSQRQLRPGVLGTIQAGYTTRRQR